MHLCKPSPGRAGQRAGWCAYASKWGCGLSAGPEVRWNRVILGGPRSALAMRERCPCTGQDPMLFITVCFGASFTLASHKNKSFFSSARAAQCFLGSDEQKPQQVTPGIVQATPLRALGGQASRERARGMFPHSYWSEALPTATKPLRACPQRSGARPAVKYKDRDLVEKILFYFLNSKF